LEAEPGTLRIAAVGGSTTFGIGSWPGFIEEDLRARQETSTRCRRVLVG
jgi:hypothetical protein